MQTNGSTGRIRITKVPSGDAPFKIREAWVGLILPCDPYLGYPDEGLERGILTNIETSRNCYGFSVPQDRAIALLEQEKPKAAAWWKEHNFPQHGCYFGFAETEVEIVSGITRQKIIEVTDGMMGDPNR